MTSSNGNIFHVTGHLCGEITGHRRIPRTKASDVELWCVLWSEPERRLSKQSWGWWFRRHRAHYGVMVMRYKYLISHVHSSIRPEKKTFKICDQYIAGIMQDCRISIANEREIYRLMHQLPWITIFWSRVKWLPMIFHWQIASRVTKNRYSR